MTQSASPTHNITSKMSIAGPIPPAFGRYHLPLQTLVDDLEDASNELMLADEEEVIYTILKYKRK